MGQVASLESKASTSPQSSRSTPTKTSAFTSFPDVSDSEWLSRMIQSRSMLRNNSLSQLIQTKLTIGTPGDKFEREADAMADHVLGMGKTREGAAVNSPVVKSSVATLSPLQRAMEEGRDDLSAGVSEIQEKSIQMHSVQKTKESDSFESKTPGSPKPLVTSTKPASMPGVSGHEILSLKIQKESMEEDTGEIALQRNPENDQGGFPFEASEIQEKRIQRKEEEEQTEDIQEKLEDFNINLQRQADSEASISESFESRLNNSGTGSKLPVSTKSQMEAGIGADFSPVNIHTDSHSVQLNKELGSQAFTHGNDIYFNAGKYDTSSDAGQHLLAHELTHTVQQGAAVRKKVEPGEETEEEPSSDGSEIQEKSIQGKQGVEGLHRKGEDQTPNVQTALPALAAPVVIWGGRYLAGKLVRWGIKKAFSEETEMVSYGETILKELLAMPIDFKGQSKFNPPSYVEKHIQSFGLMADWAKANKEIAHGFSAKFKKEMEEGPKLNIKFGEMGSRNGVPIRWYESSQTYKMNPHFMPLKHEAFNTSGAKLVPQLGIGIDKADSSIYGGIAMLPTGILGSATSKALMRRLMDKGMLAQLVFGEDYDKENFTEFLYINDILSGNLFFQLTGIQTIGGGQTLIGSLVVINGTHAWAGMVNTKIKGIDDTEIPVERDAKSRINGLLKGISLAGDWNKKVGNFTGTLEASFINGLLNMRGDLTYSSDRIPQANVTLWVTTKEQAWEAAEKRLPPEAKKEDRAFEKKDELAITGWGSMEIILIKDKPQKKGKGGKGAKADDNFLTGRAAAVVDPDGYLTMSGELIFKNKILFLEALGGDLKDVYKKERRRLAYVNVHPGIGVRVMGEASLQAGYQIGPVYLYEVSVKGVYSNNPDIDKQLELTTRINGVAGLKAKGEISGDVELRLGTRWDYLGVSPAKVSLIVDATGELRGYMDLAPTIGVKNEKGADTENIPKYFFKGKLSVGGELDLVASAKVALKVLGAGYEGKYEFLKRTVPGAAVDMDWDYTFGDPITLESLQKMTRIKRGKFDPPKMMREMFKKQRAKETDEIKGGYKEGKKKLGEVGGEEIPIPEDETPDREVIDDFKMLGSTHHLYLHYEEGKTEPTLKMASNPEHVVKKVEIARNKLATEIPSLDEDDKKLLEKRLGDLDKIKKAANKVIKHAAQLGVGMSKLKKSNIPGFEELGDLISEYGTKYGVDDLSGKFAAGETPGTETNPFEIEWPKPPSASYEPLYFGGKLDEPRSQGIMKGLYSKGSKDVTGNVVKKFNPHTGGTLPGGEKIGISSGFRTFAKRVIGPLSTEGTPGGDKLNRILKRYGYLPGRDGDGMDADHIVEIQFGGKDTVENLWPLDSDINQESGRTLKDAEVAYPKTGKKIRIKELKKKMRKYYFKITGFDY